MSMEQALRTFVCGVVSVDLVGYSKLPVSDQIDLKAQFNSVLGDTLAPIATDGRIILDTGDGVVVGFLNDPEDALYFAMALSRTTEAMAADTGKGRLRIGINLGPVRLGSDLNQHATLVGDGINVAEQIMGFALPGTVVASRPFHDFAGRLSGAYESLFHFEGSRTDKHVRDHEVYTVRDDDRAFQVVRRGVLERAGLALPQDSPPSAGSTLPGTAVASAKPAAAAPTSASAGAFLHDPAKVGFAALLLASIALLEGYLLWNKFRVPAATENPLQISSAPTQEAARTVPDPVPTPPAAPAAAPTSAARPPAPAAAPRVEPKAEPPAPKAAPIPEKTAPVVPKPTPRESVPDIPAKTSPAAPPPVTKPAVEEKRVPDIRKPVEPVPEPKRPPRKSDPAPKQAEVVSPPSPAPAPVIPVVPSPIQQPAPAPAPVPAPAPIARPLAPITRTATEFPVAAVRQGISEGRVKARATINAAGNVTGVEILSSYPQRIFDRSVIESVSQWKFPPGADRRSYEVDVEFKR